MSLFVVSRLVAVVGFLLTACWALIAVALATDSNSIRNAAVIAIVIMLAVVFGRIVRSPIAGQFSLGDRVTPRRGIADRPRRWRSVARPATQAPGGHRRAGLGCHLPQRRERNRWHSSTRPSFSAWAASVGPPMETSRVAVVFSCLITSGFSCCLREPGPGSGVHDLVRCLPDFRVLLAR